MMVVGVTGGIGSGKSTVTDLFAERGIVIVDADIVARQLVARGQPCLTALSEQFGPEVLLDNGELNRSWLRHKIFSDPQAKVWVDALLHPAIRKELVRQLQAARSPYVMLSAPLLVENQLTAYCDRVLVVDVSETTQKVRTQKRDRVAADHVERIMQAQAARQQRLAVADDVIDNNGPLAALNSQVAKLHEFYLSIATKY